MAMTAPLHRLPILTATFASDREGQDCAVPQDRVRAASGGGVTMVMAARKLGLKRVAHQNRILALRIRRIEFVRSMLSLTPGKKF
jgi:hypothetical protein